MNFKTFLKLVVFLGFFLPCQFRVPKAPDIVNYFNLTAKDLSEVTWAHAVNSQKLLKKYISDSTIHMIEGDVSLGKLISHSEANASVPVMAKPPQNTSDVTLVEWMEIFIGEIRKGKKKGVKLDFEDLNVAISALGNGLKNVSSSIDGFPFWLHTNILKGPGAGDNDKIVNSDVFLSLCTEFYPQAVLSLGWTTVYNSSVGSLHYSKEMIDQMISTVKKNNIQQPITFPIRAPFDNRSIASFKELLKSVPKGSFTVWSKPTDQIDPAILVKFSKETGDDKAYFDLPKEHMKKYREAKNSSPSSIANQVLIVVLSPCPAVLFYLNFINHYAD